MAKANFRNFHTVRKDEDIFKKLNEQVLDELVKIKEVIADEHDEAIPIPKHTAAHFLTT